MPSNPVDQLFILKLKVVTLNIGDDVTGPVCADDRRNG